MKNFPVKIISLACLFLFCGALIVQAQTEQRQRWLLIFSTSSAMKKRQPAVEAEIKTLFETGFGEKISDGDSIGVWMIGDKLKPGGFPLMAWSSENVPALTTNLIGYIRVQKTTGGANLSALQPLLGQVMANSERLTIVIFCDGTEQIDWTPYDGINDTLRQTVAERKQSREPVLVILRSQQGKFIGGMVNFPPVPLSLPPFPPLPGEAKPAGNPPSAAAVTVAAPPRPAAAPVASLIIVGTHVSTNEADATNLEPVVSGPVAAIVPKTNPPAAPVASVLPVITSTPPVTAATPATPAAPPVIKTNPPVVIVVITNPAAAIVQTPVKETNPPVVAAGADDHIEKFLTYAGIGLLVAAGGLVIFLVRRKNAPRGSLITSSMQDNFRPKDRP